MKDVLISMRDSLAKNVEVISIAKADPVWKGLLSFLKSKRRVCELAGRASSVQELRRIPFIDSIIVFVPDSSEEENGYRTIELIDVDIQKGSTAFVLCVEDHRGFSLDIHALMYINQETRSPEMSITLDLSELIENADAVKSIYDVSDLLGGNTLQTDPGAEYEAGEDETALLYAGAYSVLGEFFRNAALGYRRKFSTGKVGTIDIPPTQALELSEFAHHMRDMVGEIHRDLAESVYEAQEAEEDAKYGANPVSEEPEDSVEAEFVHDGRLKEAIEEGVVVLPTPDKIQ